MHEIIHIVDPATLSGTPRQNLEIEAVNEHVLTTGYYFVLWPSRKAIAHKRGKRYFGPLRTPAQARLLLTSARMLGLVHDDLPSPMIIECRSIVRQAPAANDWHPGPTSQQAYAVC